MPDTFLWTERYSVGVGLLDSQHQTLMELTDTLVSGCTEAASDTIKPYFNHRITAILDYLMLHFKTEDQFLSLLQYPGAAAHRRNHTRCMGEIYYWLNEINFPSTRVVLSFVRYLRERIFDHVTSEDQGYGRYILSFKHQESQILHSEYA
jgi:hemerythrin